MGKITDIVPQKRNKTRVSLFIDGDFFCGMERITVLEHRLKIGDEVSEQKLRAAVFDSEVTAAFEKAMRYLGPRARTEKELRTFFYGKGFAADVAERAMQKLQGYGYVDDAAFAQSYIEGHRVRYGAKKLAAELRQKGVSEQVAQDALEGLDQSADALAVARKYLRTHAPNRFKLRGYLYGKGFSSDAIDAAADALDEEGVFVAADFFE